ncbi:MAG TPA: hypothetical protein DGG95_09080 [Cytophagales bacterium]|jgi:hypothetical protein|nr:hypothetical protein [Cytophagales bacterium]
MSAWLIVLISLWVFPIVTFFLVKWSKNSKIENKIIVIISGVILLTTISLLTEISTRSIETDWIFLTSYYLGICYFLWRIVNLKSKLVKILGYVLITITFSVGYLSGTIGVLGVGFVVSEFEPSKEDKLDSNLIYKETNLGNAVSHYRGIKVEIFKTFKYFPFLERRVSINKYYGKPGWSELTHSFDSNSKTVKLIVKKNETDSEDWEAVIKVE